jgi:hypothetical protein
MDYIQLRGSLILYHKNSQIDETIRVITGRYAVRSKGCGCMGISDNELNDGAALNGNNFKGTPFP